MPATSTVDSARPANVSDTNGSTWRRKDGRPLWFHTHRRLSSNDGNVPARVAITFAETGRIAPLAISAASVSMLVIVATTDVAA